MLIDAKGSKQTRRSYAADFGLWCAFCGAARVDPRRATLGDATAFRTQLEEQGRASASVNRALAALLFLYRTLHKNRPPLVAGNPFDPNFLAWPKLSREGKTAVVPAEIAEAMLAAARRTSQRDYAILRLLYDTGIRRAEVASLERTRVDLARKEILIVLKGGRVESSALVDETVDALHLWLAQRALGLALRVSRGAAQSFTKGATRPPRHDQQGRDRVGGACWRDGCPSPQLPRCFHHRWVRCGSARIRDSARSAPQRSQDDQAIRSWTARARNSWRDRSLSCEDTTTLNSYA